jgi:hypothetical protein
MSSPWTWWSNLQHDGLIWLTLLISGPPAGPIDPQLTSSIPATAIVAVEWSGVAHPDLPPPQRIGSAAGVIPSRTVLRGVGRSDANLTGTIALDPVAQETGGAVMSKGWSALLAEPELQRLASALNSLTRPTSAPQKPDITPQPDTVQPTGAAHAEGAAQADGAQPASAEQPLPNIAGAVATLLKYPGCLYVNIPPLIDSQGRIRPVTALLEAALVLKTGAHTEQCLKELEPWLPVGWRTIPNPQPVNFPTLGPVTLTRHEGLLIWSAGSGTTEQVIARLNSVNHAAATPQGLNLVPPSLAERAEFQAANAQVGMAQPVIRIWCDITRIFNRWGRISLPDDAARNAWAGVFNNQQLLLTAGLEHDHWVCRGFWQDLNRPAAAGVLASPLDETMWEWIPADAHWVAVAPLPTELVSSQLMAVRERSGPVGQMVWELVRRQLHQRLGTDVLGSMWTAFGPSISCYSSPATSGALPLSPVCALSVRDVAAAQQLVAEWRAQLQRTSSQRGSAEGYWADELCEEVVLTTWHTSDRQWQGLAPTFCLTDQQLLFALQPQALRSHLRFVQSAAPRWTSRWNESMAPAMGPQATTIAWSYLDSRAVSSVVWPLVPYVAGPAIHRVGLSTLGVTAALLPAWSTLEPHLQPMTTELLRTPTGWMVEVRHPFSGLLPLLSAAALWNSINPSPQMSQPGLVPQLAGPNASPLSSSNGRFEQAGGLPDPLAPETDSAGGVRPALATQPATPGTNAAPNRLRPLAPDLLRALTPDAVEGFIPPSVFDRLEQGPSPEVLERRAARRKARELRRPGGPLPPAASPDQPAPESDAPKANPSER